MRAKFRVLFLCVVGLAFGAGLLSLGCNTSPAAQVGQAAPDFSLRTLSGEQVQLSQLRGKVVLVNFWASWCVPCREEAPNLEQAWRRYKDQGFVLLGVDIQESPSAAQGFVNEFNLSFPVPMDTDGKVSEKYLIDRLGIPTSYFIDKEGIVRHLKVGPMTMEFISSRLDALLEK